LRWFDNLSCCKRVSISFTKFATSESWCRRPQFVAQLRQFRGAERFGTGRLVDQLPRAIEIPCG